MPCSCHLSGQDVSSASCSSPRPGIAGAACCKPGGCSLHLTLLLPGKRPHSHQAHPLIHPRAVGSSVMCPEISSTNAGRTLLLLTERSRFKALLWEAGRRWGEGGPALTRLPREWPQPQAPPWKDILSSQKASLHHKGSAWMGEVGRCAFWNSGLGISAYYYFVAGQECQAIWEKWSRWR